MLRETQSGIYQSTLLLSVPGLTHGYSSRKLGDMRQMTQQKAFLNRLGLSYAKLVMAQQVHSALVKIINSDSGKVVAGVDSLVSRTGGVLSIHVADCVPILAVEPNSSVVGIAHAGWRGTLGQIAEDLVKTMTSLGANPQNILVSLGPHIGMCCYDVNEDRARKFLNRFDNDPKVASVIEGNWHLDLGCANYRQLLSSGILPEHIDALPSCTSCQVNQFYSYRKDSEATFGEIMGVIALN